MSDLTILRDRSRRLHARFLAEIRAINPTFNEYHWYRAVSAAQGENVRRNDDTSFDAALASSEAIRSAHDAYIYSLHAFYYARDGEYGFLGGEGL
jgi:hypothetical protein